MSRINSNIPSVIAQSNLVRTQKELSLRLERLSTGLRINRGADDPAGLIISERLRSDIQGVSTGIKNAERASSMISTTEASLAEVNDLLNSIRSLIVESANTGANSPDERSANQLQIDSAIDSITRIANTATFGGLKLLNGSLAYQTSAMHASAIAQATIWNASRVGNNVLSVDVDVVASAQTGALYYNGNTVPPGVTLSSMTLQITGPSGVQEITLPSNQSLSKLVSAVNSLTSLTGVQASLINGDPNSGVVFTSVEFGSDAFVSVRRLGGPPDPTNDSWATYKLDNNAPVSFGPPFDWSNTALVASQRDEGQDVSALVNGTLASGKGLRVSVNSTSLGLELLLTKAFATDPNAANSTFDITGGGALFQIGQDVTALQQANLGIPSVAASNLGGTQSPTGALAFLSSLKTGQGYSIAENVASGDFTTASSILDRAIDEVTIMRGRLGAFEKNVLQTNVRSLQSSFENLSASQSQIRDADFAQETSMLTRAQILASAGTTVLGLANQQSQQVLQLLG